jgi:hypothetical protein
VAVRISIDVSNKTILMQSDDVQERRIGLNGFNGTRLTLLMQRSDCCENLVLKRHKFLFI